MSRRVTIHVRDGVYGRPAAGVPVRVERTESGGWVVVSTGETGADGTLAVLGDEHHTSATYRLCLDTGGYYAALGASSGLSELAVTVALYEQDAPERMEITLAPCSSVVYAQR